MRSNHREINIILNIIISSENLFKFGFDFSFNVPSIVVNCILAKFQVDVQPVIQENYFQHYTVMQSACIKPVHQCNKLFQCISSICRGDDYFNVHVLYFDKCLNNFNLWMIAVSKLFTFIGCSFFSFHFFRRIQVQP